MIPRDLQSRHISLPKVGEPTIVAITGSELRHERFVLQLREEFGDALVGWYRVVRESAPVVESQISRPLWRRIGGLLLHPSRWRRVALRIARKVKPKRRPLKVRIRMAERRMFGVEVERLRGRTTPHPVNVSDPNDEAVVSEIQALNPYFLVTMGGAIYQSEILECAKGLAMNQHDGWCPEYRGSNTVDWTIYHRDLARVGNTVHVLTRGMDSGPILRRSRACLIESDSRETCFLRSVALGTQLLCEVLQEAMETSELKVYDQRAGTGATFRFIDLLPEIEEAVEREFETDQVARALRRRSSF